MTTEEIEAMTTEDMTKVIEKAFPEVMYFINKMVDNRVNLIREDGLIDDRLQELEIQSNLLLETHNKLDDRVDVAFDRIDEIDVDDMCDTVRRCISDEVDEKIEEAFDCGLDEKIEDGVREQLNDLEMVDNEDFCELKSDVSDNERRLNHKVDNDTFAELGNEVRELVENKPVDNDSFVELKRHVGELRDIANHNAARQSDDLDDIADAHADIHRRIKELVDSKPVDSKTVDGLKEFLECTINEQKELQDENCEKWGVLVQRAMDAAVEPIQKSFQLQFHDDMAGIMRDFTKQFRAEQVVINNELNLAVRSETEAIKQRVEDLEDGECVLHTKIETVIKANEVLVDNAPGTMERKAIINNLNIANLHADLAKERVQKLEDMLSSLSTTHNETKEERVLTDIINECAEFTVNDEIKARQEEQALRSKGIIEIDTSGHDLPYGS